MTDWYRVVCEECRPPGTRGQSDDHFRSTRWPSESHAGIRASVHNRERHDGDDVAEVAEA